MKKLLIALSFCALLCSCSNNAAKVDPVVKQYLQDSLETLKARCQQTLDAAYMADKLICEKTDIPGWEGYPVQLYEYYTGVDIKINQPKKGLVYLLDPSPEKLAKWIVNAVFDVTGKLEYDDIEKVRQYITWQSGAQFPVSGVVYEDMYTKGFHEPYVFKDGITVYIADPQYFPADKHCTEEQLQYYLTVTNDQLKENTGRYARICSTTREMYYAAGGTVDVGYSEDGKRSKAFMAEIARCYKEAWNSDRNFLIYAWAKANLAAAE